MGAAYALTGDLDCRRHRSRSLHPALLDNLEGHPLAMPRCRGTQEIADGVDGMPVLANHLADVALTQLKAEGDLFGCLHLGQHHLLRKFNQLPYDIFEKLFHAYVLGLRIKLAQAARAEGVRFPGINMEQRQGYRGILRLKSHSR